MRSSSVLDALFPAVRRQILGATLLQPEKWWYLTELASHLGTSPSSLQRELQSLTRSGLLELKQDGRRTYYKARTDSPVFADLRQLFARTAGIVPLLQSEIARLPKIAWAFLYGSIARGEEDARSDIDLMIVGSIATARLLPVLRRLEQRFNREVNLTRYSEDEFYAKVRTGDHFLTSVLKEQLLMLKGSRDDLEAAARSA